MGARILASCFSSRRKPASGPVISAAVCFVRSAAIRPGAAPSGSRWMPSCPQPSAIESRLASQSVSEPGVETVTSLPLRSATVLIGESMPTIMQRSRGAPSIAAIASAGDPLAAKAMPGPLPRPKSMPPAANACCTLPSPPSAEIFTSRPYLANMPEATPTSAGRNSEIKPWAFPTVTWSAANVGAAIATTKAIPSPAFNELKVAAVARSFTTDPL